MQDHYLALGVGSGASQADIRKAYRLQAARYHPDRNAAPDAPARFRAVQEAYDILGDPASRETYDNNRKRNLLDDPLETARGIWADYFQRLI